MIELDAVPKKYEGLDGTELAISESQERMACVIAPDMLERFKQMAYEENLEATQVAVVTEEARLVMHWRGKTIVDLSRAFLDTNDPARRGGNRRAGRGRAVSDEKAGFREGSHRARGVAGDALRSQHLLAEGACRAV